MTDQSLTTILVDSMGTAKKLREMLLDKFDSVMIFEHYVRGQEYVLAPKNVKTICVIGIGG